MYSTMTSPIEQVPISEASCPIYVALLAQKAHILMDPILLRRGRPSRVVSTPGINADPSRHLTPFQDMTLSLVPFTPREREVTVL